MSQHYGDQSYGYNPKVDNPRQSNNIPQTRSGGFQAPFYFGGSQVPINLGSMSGRGFTANPIGRFTPITGRAVRSLARPVIGTGYHRRRLL